MVRSALVAAALTLAAGFHYGEPPCQEDEVEVVAGDGTKGYIVCSKPCEFSDDECPSDVPPGATWGGGTPFCDTTKHQCHIACSASWNVGTGGCPEGMKCEYSGSDASRKCGWTTTDPLPPPAPTPSFPPSPPADVPNRPHLAQAWTAEQTGDGLDGETAEESYIYVDELIANKLDYGSECMKLVYCDTDFDGDCTAYYTGDCAVTECCYCEGVDIPKQYDILPNHEGKLDTIETHFVGYDDTTELDDKEVKGAEHWQQLETVVSVKVGYDYFFHREQSGDVITHRIDFNTSVGVGGSILYGNFQVQHDIPSFLSAFKTPEICKGDRVMDCGDCDDNGVARIDAKYFKQAHARRLARQAQAESVINV